MTRFEYQARNNQGELQVGFVEAPDKEGAIRILASNGLFVLSITEAKKTGVEASFRRIFDRVSDKDLMIFTRQFSTLLGSSVPLSGSLRTLAAQTRNPRLKETIVEMQKEIDGGLSLSQAMEKFGDIFSEFYVNMIRSAEVTGRVDEVMNFLADYLEKQTAMAGKVRGAMIYPVFMIILLFVVITAMAVFVFPKIEDVFTEMGATLPPLTLAVIGIGKFLVQWWWAVILVAGFIVAIIADYLRSKEGKVMLDELVLRIPIFSGILKYMYISRFADSVAVLIRGGVAIVQALEITARTVGSEVYKEIIGLAVEDVRNGVLLSQALAKYPEHFPPLTSQMISIGESTGRLEFLLQKVSSFYGRELDDIVGNLVELIQPLLMLVIGVVVGILFASILVPMYDFLGNVLN